MTFLDVLGIVLGIIAISFFVICYGGTLIYLYKSLEKEKRVAALISLVLCIIIYLTLLTSVFTKQVDTYICYTTETGECYHAETCRYLWNSAKETTVYEALGEYRSCSYCNPQIEKYETTLIVRNYEAPFFISVPIAVGIYILLAFRKKKAEE